MRVLLFGNKGQVGREIEDLAKIKNIEVLSFDVDNADITSAIQLEEIFEKNQDIKPINIVINAAAYTNVDKAEEEPQVVYQANYLGAHNLATICRQYDIPLIHISTDYVFSGEKIEGYTEDDMPNPINAYGQSKLAGDNTIQETWHKHIILRVSWVFGKYGKNFVKTILRLAQEQETLNIVSDQFGCPTAAADIARVILKISEKIIANPKPAEEKWGIYNYCNYPTTTWYDFAVKIIEIAKKYSLPLKVKKIEKITSDNFPSKTKRPRNSELIVEKIIGEYGISRKSWQEYLPEQIL